MQSDQNGNAIVWDVYESNGGPWTKNHGEYPSEEAAQKKCDELAACFPDRSWKPRKRRGMKVACYAA